MAKFSKYNNPKKKKIRKKPDYNERCIMAGKAMLTDYRLGYDLPVSFYEEAFKLKKD